MKQKEFNGPYYVALHINNYCKKIPMTQKGAIEKGLNDHCPCRLSWLCDGVFNGKLHMSNQYDEKAKILLEQNFPKESTKIF